MITLDNVEIYLTDYADGELSPAQERELKAFLLLHPELEESLEDWKFAKLTPPVIRYPHKSQLKQMVSEGSIPGDAPPQAIQPVRARQHETGVLHPQSDGLRYKQAGRQTTGTYKTRTCR